MTECDPLSQIEPDRKRIHMPEVVPLAELKKRQASAQRSCMRAIFGLDGKTKTYRLQYGKQRSQRWVAFG